MNEWINFNSGKVLFCLNRKEEKKYHRMCDKMGLTPVVAYSGNLTEQQQQQNCLNIFSLMECN